MTDTSPWQFISKGLLATCGAILLHLSLFDAIFIVLSTDVIQKLISLWIDGK